MHQWKLTTADIESTWTMCTKKTMLPPSTSVPGLWIILVYQLVGLRSTFYPARNAFDQDKTSNAVMSLFSEKTLEPTGCVIPTIPERVFRRY